MQELNIFYFLQCFSLMVLCTLVSRVTLFTNTDLHNVLYFGECTNQCLKWEERKCMYLVKLSVQSRYETRAINFMLQDLRLQCHLHHLPVTVNRHWKLMLTFPTPKHISNTKTITYQSPTNHHVTGFTKSASTSMVQSFNMHQQIYIIIHYFLSICVLVTNLLK